MILLILIQYSFNIILVLVPIFHLSLFIASCVQLYQYKTEVLRQQHSSLVLMISPC